jgi:hypothetical protein
MGVFFRWSIVLAACIGVIGCVSGAQQRTTALEERLIRCVGHSMADVIIDHGPPTNTIDLGGNKRLFQWQRSAHSHG